MTIPNLGFGRAPQGSLLLLAHPRAPGSYATDASLQDMANRMAFSIMCIPVTLLGFYVVASQVVQMCRPSY